MGINFQWYEISNWLMAGGSICVCAVLMILSFSSRRRYGSAASMAGLAFAILLSIQVWYLVFSMVVSRLAGGTESIMTFYAINNLVTTCARLFSFWLLFNAIFKHRASDAVQQGGHLQGGTPLADVGDENPYASPHQ